MPLSQAELAIKAQIDTVDRLTSSNPGTLEANIAKQHLLGMLVIYRLFGGTKFKNIK